MRTKQQSLVDARVIYTESFWPTAFRRLSSVQTSHSDRTSDLKKRLSESVGKHRNREET